MEIQWKYFFGGSSGNTFDRYYKAEFKVLMHCGQYVDANLLEEGIYASSKPFIYSKDETIETMIERGRIMKDMTKASFISERYFDNLKQCELVSILITEVRS